MRIFGSCREAYYEIRRDLLEVGEWVQGFSYQDKIVENDPQFDFMELHPYVYTITDTSDTGVVGDLLELDWAWIQREHQERMIGGLNPGQAWKLRDDVWGEFLETNCRFSYTYSERFGTGDQIHAIIRELQRHPHSRQAIVSVYRSDLDLPNVGGSARIPCSMFYQFMVRNNKLDLYYVMRSCDFFTHFPYDMILAINLQNHVASCLNQDLGPFTHMITSLHAFRKDFGAEVF